jgi:hypothetical protein
MAPGRTDGDLQAASGIGLAGAHSGLRALVSVVIRVTKADVRHAAFGLSKMLRSRYQAANGGCASAFSTIKL